METVLFSFDNEVFSYFAFYSTLVVMKVFAVTLVVGHYRTTHKVYLNDEDAKMMKGAVKSHPDVDRARRLHQNDLENIPMYVLVGIFYVLTKPSPVIALWHFRIFLFSRLVHTISYWLALQPFRALAMFGGLIPTVSMAVQILMYAPFW